MNIMNFVMYYILTMNSLFAQGYHYDPYTNQLIPPTQVTIQTSSPIRSASTNVSARRLRIVE